jgi:type I restriction enzyme M protein
MLNVDTRRKIDSCRDILVGKLPDPKAQIEQITYALIYKFMADMDTASVALGGKAGFFVNGYAQYTWDKLMSTNLPRYFQGCLSALPRPRNTQYVPQGN